jgi:hypothetical protein
MSHADFSSSFDKGIEIGLTVGSAMLQSSGDPSTGGKTAIRVYVV